jgi:hypothetical protein
LEELEINNGHGYPDSLDKTTVGKRHADAPWKAAVAGAGWLCPDHRIDGVLRHISTHFCTIGSGLPAEKQSQKTRHAAYTPLSPHRPLVVIAIVVYD